MGPPKVMVVDDDRTMVTLLRTLLELDGYQVVQPKNAASVLESIAAERPDLVLMDVFLKGQDGIDLVRGLRKLPELALTPVVMTSGMDVSEQSLAAGANSFMLKPYDPDVLLQTIRSQLGQTGGTKRET
ncbi:MAG TPA: response regulator [Anaerolineales bacterium]|nr:response regulator [Anaerolineales bacterium]